MALLSTVDQLLDVFWPPPLFLRDGPEITREIVRRPRERTHWIALAAFKNEYCSLVPLLCQPATGDRSSEPSSNDDRCVALFVSHCGFLLPQPLKRTSMCATNIWSRRAPGALLCITGIRVPREAEQEETPAFPDVSIRDGL